MGYLSLLQQTARVRCCGTRPIAGPRQPISRRRHVCLPSVQARQWPTRTCKGTLDVFRRSAGTSASTDSQRTAAEAHRDSAHLPEWLPIYHTGNASIALTSAAKIFAFSFIGLASTVIAPIFYQVGVEAVAEGYSPWLKYILPAAIMSAATLPLYVTVFSPSASVTYIQIALPAAARRSRGALQAWARRIPGNTRVLITTQRASLNARQTLTCMDELKMPAVMGRPGAGRADVVAGPGSAPRDSNVLGVAGSATSRDYGTLPLQIMRQRLPGWQPPLNTGRLRWLAREPRLFVVRARINKAKELMVWDRFVEQIRRR